MLLPLVLSMTLAASLLSCDRPATGRHIDKAFVQTPDVLGWVSDHAALLSSEERVELATLLAEFEARTGNGFAVLTVPTTGPESIEEFSLRVAREWGVGKQKLNNGLLIVLAYHDASARIECGEGLAKSTVPDAVAEEVMDDHMVPAFSEKRWHEGLMSGLTALMDLVEDAPGERLPGAILGTVVDGDTGEALPGTSCIMRMTWPSGLHRTSWATAGAHGEINVQVPGRAPSALEIEATFLYQDRQLGAYVSKRTLALPHTLGVVPLHPLRALTIRAVSEDGSPALAEAVTLDPSEVQSRPEQETIELEGVVPEAVRVLVTAKGYEPQIVLFEGIDEAVVSLARTTGIEVVVVDWQSFEDLVVTFEAPEWPFRTPADRGASWWPEHPQFKRRRFGFGVRGRLQSCTAHWEEDGTIGRVSASLMPGRFTGRAWCGDVSPGVPISVYVATTDAPDRPLHDVHSVTLEAGEWRVLELYGN